MTFGERLSKLLTNKFVLYFVVFLAATNILGYLITNKIKPVIYFTLISFLTSYFSRNMIVILLVGLFLTNLLVSKEIIEGLTNNDMIITDDEEERLIDIDEELKTGIDALRETKGDVTKAKEIISE